MVVKDKDRIERLIRSAKAINKMPHMIVKIPLRPDPDFREKNPGGDRHVLASVWAIDGKAIVVPATRRCGILRVDWSLLMRYLRRRAREEKQKAKP